MSTTINDHDVLTAYNTLARTDRAALELGDPATDPSTADIHAGLLSAMQTVAQTCSLDPALHQQHLDAISKVLQTGEGAGDGSVTFEEAHTTRRVLDAIAKDGGELEAQAIQELATAVSYTVDFWETVHECAAMRAAGVGV